MKSGITRDRKVRRGLDREKLVRIWKVLESGEWLHIAEIARQAGLNECTVRWYLNQYLNQAVEQQQIAPTIRLRMVRLKAGMDLVGYMTAMKTIAEVKKSK